MVRKLYEIAADIRYHWRPVGPTARPYLEAMDCLDTLDSSYGMVSGREIVRYFLANAHHFRGEDARRLKAELNGMLKGSVT